MLHISLFDILLPKMFIKQPCYVVIFFTNVSILVKHCANPSFVTKGRKSHGSLNVKTNLKTYRMRSFLNYSKKFVPTKSRHMYLVATEATNPK